MDTVTIHPGQLIMPQRGGTNSVVHKKLNCTCGWEDYVIVWKSEVRAKHHLNFVHGGGRFIFDGMEEDV